MLGHFIGMALLLTALSPLLITSIFADSFVVDFDKQVYHTGDSLVISGHILDFGMPVIAMSIYDPDGKILSANNLEISSQKNFSKTISLDSPFYEKPGKYKIELDYGQISEDHYFLVENEYLEPKVFVDDPVTPEITLLSTEKNQYTDNDVIKITGMVSALSSPTVLIGIYDPSGMPAGFYFGTINPNLEFSTSFLVKSGVNFRVNGTYSIKAHYMETQAISFFDYYKNPPVTADDNIKDKTRENKPVDEKIDDSLDEIIPEATDLPITKKPNDPEKTSVNYDSISNSSLIENSQQHESDSNNSSIIQNNDEKTIDQTKNSDIEEPKVTAPYNSKKITPKPETKEYANLTVEDEELGKLLNQINLECDSSIFTDTISYYDGMGSALYRLCKFDSSLNFFNEYLMDNPNDVGILVNKGSALGKLGYFSEAIMYYDQALKIDPDFLPAKNNKANALANLGNFDDAILLYAEVLAKNPNYISARQNLELALSQIQNTLDVPAKTTENIVFPEPTLSEKVSSFKTDKQTSSNFFDKVGIIFSSLDSLFNFLN